MIFFNPGMICVIGRKLWLAMRVAKQTMINSWPTVMHSMRVCWSNHNRKKYSAISFRGYLCRARCVRWTVGKRKQSTLYPCCSLLEKRCLSQIAKMRVNVALSDLDATSLNLARSNVKVKTIKRTKCKKYSFHFVRTNTKITKLEALDWNVNYSQFKARN